MAYTKIKCIKSATHLQTSVDYITNPMKTNDKVYVGSYMCSADYAVRDFYSVLSMAIKKGNNVAHHICQSFSPEENITPQQALEVGQELIGKSIRQIIRHSLKDLKRLLRLLTGLKIQTVRCPKLSTLTLKLKDTKS